LLSVSQTNKKISCWTNWNHSARNSSSKKQDVLRKRKTQSCPWAGSTRGLGWVGSRFCSFRWVGLGWVEYDKSIYI